MEVKKIGQTTLDELYIELKKEYDSGKIRPTENTKVKSTVQENSVLDNIFGFIKNKLGSR